MQLDIYQLAQELGLQPGTIRIWLENYRFSKYRLKKKPVSYNITKDFLTMLESYLCGKKQTKKIHDTIRHVQFFRWRVGNE